MSVEIVDILGKVAPIAAACITVGGVILTALGIGTRYRQEHAVDLATKRLAFWDSYAETGISVAGSDLAIKDAIEKEVYAAIQQVRRDVDAQLAQLSWRQLLRQRRLAAKPMNRREKLGWFFLEGFGLVCLFASLGLVVWYALGEQIGRVKLPSRHEVTIVCIAMLLITGICFGEAQKMKYKREEPVIEKV